jgi:3-hydroxyisobutyrate dehydrogenase-like beta-hydroxyacid dehydrogenase
MADNTDAQTVGFVGLGVMGYPMAGHLANAGYQVRVYNRTASKLESWLNEHPGSAAATPSEAAQHADVVFMCVGNDDDVRSVVFGDHGVLAGMSSGAVLVDHTTVSSELASELDTAAAGQDCGFLDAPVSGGQAGAENGQLTIMVGGAAQTFERVRPVMDCYAKSIRLMGAAGAGQLTKMVNQICIAGVLQGLAEGLHFAEQAGLDIESVVDVISNGAAQSWQMENRHRTMASGEFEFGFAVDWMRKDLDIALSTGRALRARLPLTALVDQFYADVQSYGGSRWDTSSLIERLRRE